jgi:rare lipoprotein A
VIEAILIAAHLVGTPTSGSYTETCVATVFAHPGDRWAGGATPYLMRRVRPDDVGVAHRTLPFGTRIEITNPRTKRKTQATVIDRGPFGRRTKSGRWYNGIRYYRKFLRARKPIPTSGWTACLDITPIVQRRLRHNGKETVRFRVVKWPRKYRQRVRPRPRIVRKEDAMFYLAMVFNGTFRELKTFEDAAHRVHFAAGAMAVATANALDVWAAMWPEEATELKKEFPQAYADAEKAVLEASGS